MFRAQPDQIAATRASYYAGWSLHVACGACTSNYTIVALDPIIQRHPRATIGEVLAMLVCRRPNGRRRGCGGSPQYVAMTDHKGTVTVLVDLLSPERKRPLFQVAIPERPKG